MSYLGGKAFVVTMQPSDIREEVARAMATRTNVTLSVIGEDGTAEVSFRLRTTDHTPSESRLDLILGVTDNEEDVQVNIPTSGDSTLVVRPNHS